MRDQSRREPDTALRDQLRDLANERCLLVLLRREGGLSEINCIQRLYLEEELTVHKRKERRKAIGTRAQILT